jgi:hypothetical protein
LTVLVLAVAELATIDSLVLPKSLFLLTVFVDWIEMLAAVKAGIWLILEATVYLVNYRCLGTNC